MEIIAILLGCLFFHFDSALLKKQALPIFEKLFFVKPWQNMLVAALCFAAVLQTSEARLALFQVAGIVLMGIYFLRRYQFFTLVEASPEFAKTQDEQLQLAISTFSILAFWVLGMMGVAVYAEFWSALWHWKIDELTGLLILSEISSVLMIFLIYRAVRARKSLQLFQILGLETKGLGTMKIWILPIVIAIVYAGVTSWILESRPVQPMTPLQNLLESTTSMGVLLFFVGSAVFTAPFFEEIIFRGFFFHVIQRFKGVVFAVIFVALTFGFLHVEQYWGDWAAIAVVGCFGLILTVLRAGTGSSVPGMIAHYVYNGSLIIIPIVMIVFSNPLYLDYQLNQYRFTAEQKEAKLLESIAQYPDFSPAYNDLAWVYSEQGIKLERALELIDYALSLEPESYAFLDTKAEVLFKMGRVSQAITMEEDLLKKYPNDVYLRQQLKKFQSAN
ncbi:MAG: CPBP family intramembrane metalloprotease [Candidatus Omnitrophica bacterium]|nr:CPBP family intramembrane metalloprotease [Candidatus Omnitrophota bacterium]